MPILIFSISSIVPTAHLLRNGQNNLEMYDLGVSSKSCDVACNDGHVSFIVGIGNVVAVLNGPWWHVMEKDRCNFEICMRESMT